jgi:hypothetical protein
MTQTVGLCVTAFPAGQGPFSGVGDAGDAAFPHLGKRGGWCLLLCAAQSAKKEPLRSTSSGGAAHRKARGAPIAASPRVLFLPLCGDPAFRTRPPVAARVPWHTDARDGLPNGRWTRSSCQMSCWCVPVWLGTALRPPSPKYQCKGESHSLSALEPLGGPAECPSALASMRGQPPPKLHDGESVRGQLIRVAPPS